MITKAEACVLWYLFNAEEIPERHGIIARDSGVPLAIVDRTIINLRRVGLLKLEEGQYTTAKPIYNASDHESMHRLADDRVSETKITFAFPGLPDWFAVAIQDTLTWYLRPASAEYINSYLGVCLKWHNDGIPLNDIVRLTGHVYREGVDNNPATLIRIVNGVLRKERESLNRKLNRQRWTENRAVAKSRPRKSSLRRSLEPPVAPVAMPDELPPDPPREIRKPPARPLPLPEPYREIAPYVDRRVAALPKNPGYNRELIRQLLAGSSAETTKSDKPAG